jgi:hypothetical protein
MALAFKADPFRDRSDSAGLPQRWRQDAPLSRVALHRKGALGIPPVEISHDQCQRSRERELSAGDQVGPGRFDPKDATLPIQPREPRC